MSKKLLIVLFVCSFYLFTLLSVQKKYQIQLDKLKNDLTSCKKEMAASRNPYYSLNDLFLYAQKVKETAKVNPGMMYYSYSSQMTGPGSFQVTLTLNGAPDTAADATDLQLDFDPETVKITSIETGDAFPLYPRKTVSRDYILVTGVTSIEKNAISFGRAGKTFAVITGEILKPSIGPLFRLNTDGTKIFFNAQNITDYDSNFTTVDIAG